MRPLWFCLGAASLLLGLVGIALPLLPTVPFLLLAAVCFSRSSSNLHIWLISHPVFGKTIKDWQKYGAISLKSNRWASISMPVVIAISLAMGLGWPLLSVQALVLCAVLVFIWTRPAE